MINNKKNRDISSNNASKNNVGKISPEKAETDKNFEFYRAIAESTSDYICLISLEGKFIYANASFEQIGYKPDELIGKSGFDYLHPDNLDQLSALMKEYVDARSLNSAIEKKLPLKRILYFLFPTRYGEWRDVEANVNVVTDESGNITSFLFLARDITDLKRAESALKESERRFSRIVANVPGVVYQFQMDSDGSFSIPYMNERAGEMFDLDPSEISKDASKILNLIHEDWREGFYREIIESARVLKPFDYTGKWIFKGEERWCRAISSPERLQNGSTLWDGIITDVTDSMEDREALLVSEKRFSTMVTNIPGIVHQFILHPDYSVDIIYISEGLRELISLDPAEVKKDPAVLLDAINPGHRSGFIKSLKTAATELSHFEWEGRINVPGKELWIRAVGHLEKQPDGNILWDGVVIDITEQKKLEEELINAKANLEEKVRERTAEISAINEKLLEEIATRKKIESSLRESEERFRDISFNIGDLIWEVDSQGKVTYLSENVYKLAGYKPEDLIGIKSHELTGKTPLITSVEEQEMIIEVFFRKSAEKKAIYDLETWFTNIKGDKVCLLTNAVPITDSSGNFTGFRGVSKDITERKKAEDENMRLAAFPRESPNPILSSDEKGEIRYINPTAQQIIEQLGIDLEKDFIPPNHKELVETCLETDRSIRQIEVRVKTHVFLWTYIPLVPIKIVHIHGTDISDQKKFEEKLMHDAFHDELTGLPNRSLFIDRLGHSIKLARRNREYLFAVLFLDMDRFKLVNDSLGHIIGDRLLVEISHKLNDCIRPGDTVARFGGDEFTILLDNIRGTTDAVKVAKRIQSALSNPIKMQGHEIFSTVSIGIAMSTTGYLHPEDVLRDADTAMFHAKSIGISRYVMFDKTMHTNAIKLLEMESDLQHAIERREFRLHYQPIVSLDKLEIIGFEALLRWQHPKRGLVLPGEFISTIEESGMILPIGHWILHEACGQMSRWIKKLGSKKKIFISVNLSAKQFIQLDLINKIKKILKDANLSPEYLKLEITESLIIENYELSAVILEQLRKMKIQLCIDDFGTGYCSLSHLHHFPINTIKVDRTFIKEIRPKGDNLEIVQTIVNLAHNLGMDVIAEGVETKSQLEFLKRYGCEHGQGLLFSRPLEGNEVEVLVNENLIFKK